MSRPVLLLAAIVGMVGGLSATLIKKTPEVDTSKTTRSHSGRGYSFRRIEEMRNPRKGEDLSKCTWSTVGWYSESAAPGRFAVRRINLVGENVQSDDREGYDGNRRFQISDLARLRTEWVTPTAAEYRHVGWDQNPDNHCLPYASGGLKSGDRTYLGQDKLLNGLLAFRIQDGPYRIVWLAPSFGCHEVQDEQYSSGGLLSPANVLAGRSRLIAWAAKVDESLFERPMTYRHVPPSVHAIENLKHAAVHLEDEPARCDELKRLLAGDDRNWKLQKLPD
jgi:hypothetical protein